MKSEIIKEFSALLDEPLNRLVEKARGEGRRAIGYTCSYVPEPIIGVEGLVPVRLRAPGVSGTPMADTYLSSVICSYTRSLLEFALDGMFSGLDGWAFTASCDHLRRLYDNLEYLEKPEFNFIIDLPHKTGDDALDWYVEELASMARAISEHFDVDTGPDALRGAIEKHNKYIEVMRGIGNLRRRENPPITGTEFHTLTAALAASPAYLLLEKLSALRTELEGAVGPGDHRARLMLVGSQMDDPRYIGIIESQGGLVVADRCCVGSIPGLEPIEINGDPLRSLAAHYLGKTPCPRMMDEFGRRVDDTLRAARDFNVDGIVVETMKFCDCWGVESSLLVSALREAGYPVLRVEREYSLTGEGQLRTRIQAFIESMGK
ncbi:2-hydroxyacyl-CoA dehydratase subunit D [bacterium]